MPGAPTVYAIDVVFSTRVLGLAADFSYMGHKLVIRDVIVSPVLYL